MVICRECGSEYAAANVGFCQRCCDKLEGKTTNLIDQVADEVKTDSDWYPLPGVDSKLIAAAEHLDETLGLLDAHAEKLHAGAGTEGFDGEEWRMESARLHGRLQANARIMVITVGVWCKP